MDDLIGLEWSRRTSSSTKAQTATTNYNQPFLYSRTPSEVSRQQAPSPNPINGGKNALGASKSSTPDSFSNLVSFGSSKTSSLTLQQRQDLLEAQRLEQEVEKRKRYEAQFGSPQSWDGLGSGHESPREFVSGRSPVAGPLPLRTSDPITNSAADSLLKSSGGSHLRAPIRTSPKPESSRPFQHPKLSNGGPNSLAWAEPKRIDPQNNSSTLDNAGTDLLHDPFELLLPDNRDALQNVPANVDDDLLGDLGKPITDFRRGQGDILGEETRAIPLAKVGDEWDKAVASLVNMGFTAEQSQLALTEGGEGLDLQAAVEWLMNDAHNTEIPKQSPRHRRTRPNLDEDLKEIPENTDQRHHVASYNGQNAQQQERYEQSQSLPASDLSRPSGNVGSTLFKTANSLWKTSQKRVQKAVAGLQQELEPGQPKWMRESVWDSLEESKTSSENRKTQMRSISPSVTDEAMLLETGRRPTKSISTQKLNNSTTQHFTRDPPSSIRNTTEIPMNETQTRQKKVTDSTISMNRSHGGEQLSRAYVSPARRKKITVEPNLSSLSSETAREEVRHSPTNFADPRTVGIREESPKKPTRDIPFVSKIALQSFNDHRVAGTEHFKRGDYASAHESYTSSLAALPASHPLTIIIFCNRALTALKTGLPQNALIDADAALALIGPSRGANESIELPSGESGSRREMKEFWGKALIRKAEALEQMEKWREAGDVWKVCVAGGINNATALQGRARCEKALAPPTAPVSTPSHAPLPTYKVPSTVESRDSQPREYDAVRRLRAANVAAERLDDEKLALTDTVNEKIERWREGKRDNLRALLGSLDAVVWSDSGWVKIGMHELVTNGKVKISYMKAIGKCHPDKLPQDASTEVKLIAAAVFSTLNEGWDKFKEQNGI